MDFNKDAPATSRYLGESDLKNRLARGGPAQDQCCETRSVAPGYAPHLPRVRDRIEQALRESAGAMDRYQAAVRLHELANQHPEVAEFLDLLARI